MNKKLFIIPISLIILATIAYTGWYFGFRTKAEPQKNQPPQEMDALKTLTDLKTPGQYFLTEYAVLNPIMSLDNLSVWFFEKEQNRLIRYNLTKEDDVKEFELPPHGPVNFVVWPDTGSDFIIGTDTGRMFYDSQKRSFIQYPEQVKYISFLPGGNKTAYIWEDENGITLSSAQSDLSNYKVLVDLPSSDFHFKVSPNGRSYMLYSHSGKHPLYFVVDGIKALEPMSDTVSVIDASFSPNGQLFAYIEKREQSYFLNILNLSTKTIANYGLVNINGDFIWSEDSKFIYWVDQNGGLRNVNTESGVTSTIFDSSKVSPILELIPGRTGREFFFVEQNTNRLGRVVIPDKEN